MTYNTLKTLVEKRAMFLKHNDALNGGRGDGGGIKLLQDLKKIKEQLVIQHDLRPSEIDEVLPQLDIGNGEDFSDAINAAKLELVNTWEYDDLKTLMGNKKI